MKEKQKKSYIKKEKNISPVVKSEGLNRKKGKGVLIGFCVFFAIATVGLGTGLAFQGVALSNFETQVDNVYKRNLYDLVESVNNVETKLSKIVISTNKDFQNKTLLEVANNTDLAELCLASLPLSQTTMMDSYRFINQVGGFTKILAEKIAKGQNLSESDKISLEEIKTAISKIKKGMNDFVLDQEKDYAILDENWAKIKQEDNTFSAKFLTFENQDLNFPIMIYDGPFSDSQLNFQVKGLTGEMVTQEVAEKEIEKSFKNISSTKYQGEINSKFETYNFEVQTTNGHTLFAQVSKKGGNIITVSGTDDGLKTDKISMEEGEKIALNFAKENQIENAVCVWSDTLENCGYFNITPTENNIILYPDLVKVKVDMSSGVVIGYDSATYFTNHTKRLFPPVKISKETAKKTLPKNYQISKGRLVLAPLDYSREILCWEFEGEKDGEQYYFYINAENGKEENILKVIKTEDGSKLM